MIRYTVSSCESHLHAKMGQSIHIDIFVINLLFRAERRRRVVRHLLPGLIQAAPAHVTCTANVLEAADGVNNSLTDFCSAYKCSPLLGWQIDSSDSSSVSFPSNWKRPITVGGLGSTVSHFTVSRIANPAHHVLVFEDDAQLSGPPAKFWSTLLACVNEGNTESPGWHMLLLSATSSRGDICPSSEVSSELITPGFSYITAGYLLSPEGVKYMRSVQPQVFNGRMVVFDEMHNILARYTQNVRPELKQSFGGIPRMMMLSPLRRLVSQNQRDGTHDTELTAHRRGGTSTVLSTEFRKVEVHIPLSGGRMGPCVWWRSTEDWSEGGMCDWPVAKSRAVDSAAVSDEAVSGEESDETLSTTEISSTELSSTETLSNGGSALNRVSVTRNENSTIRPMSPKVRLNARKCEGFESAFSMARKQHFAILRILDSLGS